MRPSNPLSSQLPSVWGILLASVRLWSKPLRVVIISRNRESAEQTIASFPKPISTDAKHHSPPCNASLMKNAAETTRIITDQLPKITYFVSSCGALTSPLARRAETVEGIHRKLALHYYAGWKFIDVLIRKAEGAGDERGMIAVAAGCGESVDLHDLGLKKNSSIGIAATACATYNDLSIEVCFS